MAWSISTRALVAKVLNTQPCVYSRSWANSSWPEQNGRHFSDDFFKFQWKFPGKFLYLTGISVYFIATGSIGSGDYALLPPQPPWPKSKYGYTRKILFIKNDIKFLSMEWRPRYSLKNFVDHFGLHASVIFNTQHLWFLVHLYVGLIPNSSGQLAELIVYIISPDEICIVARSYWQ